MANINSNIKLITSGKAPTVDNLAKGQLAFGAVSNENRLYGNTGDAVVELGGGSGSGGGSQNLQQVTDRGANTTNSLTVAKDTNEGVYGSSESVIGSGKSGTGDTVKYSASTVRTSGAYKAQHTATDGTSTYTELTDDSDILKKVSVDAKGSETDKKNFTNLVADSIIYFNSDADLEAFLKTDKVPTGDWIAHVNQDQSETYTDRLEALETDVAIIKNLIYNLSEDKSTPIMRGNINITSGDKGSSHYIKSHDGDSDYDLRFA